MAKSGSSTVQYNLREIQKAFTSWDYLFKYQLQKIYIPMTLMINNILITNEYIIDQSYLQIY